MLTDGKLCSVSAPSTAADTASAAQRQNCFSLSHIHAHSPDMNLFPQDKTAGSSPVQASSRHPYPTLLAGEQHLCSSIPAHQASQWKMNLSLCTCCYQEDPAVISLSFFPGSLSESVTTYEEQSQAKGDRTNAPAARAKVTLISTSAEQKVQKLKESEKRPKAQHSVSLFRV